MNIKSISFIVGLIALLIPSTALAEQLDADTFAGFGTEITFSDLDDFDGEMVTFVVYLPDDSIIEEDIKVRRGKATFELEANDTIIHGFYEVELEDDFGDVIASGEFEVFEDVPADLVRELLGEASVSQSSSASRRSALSASLLDDNSASLIDEYDRDVDNSSSRRSGGYIDHFDISVENRVVRINEQVDFTISAKDRNGGRVDDYIGTVTVETTDPDAQVPRSPVEFFASDRGSVDLPLALMFGTPGSHTIYVQDEDDADIAGDIDVRVVGRSNNVGQGSIVIESPTEGSTIGSSTTVRGSAPVFINLELINKNATDGTEELLVTGESDGNGNFALQFNLSAGREAYSLIVREGDGGLDRESGVINVSIDTSAPILRDIALLPNTLLAGEPFTITVTAESGVVVEAEITGAATVQLAASGAPENGLSTYQSTINAPQSAGNFAIEVTARDTAGNESVQVRTLTVQSAGLSVVRGFRAEGVDRDILLSWNQITDANQYRIYFGASPNDLTSHIDTGSNAGSARLTGLKGGQTYYFAITAIDAMQRESIAKSEVVSAVPIGSIFELRMSPHVNGAQMQWVNPANVSASAYRIQYGVQSGMYSEQRLIGAESMNYNLVDLINGVTYYVLIGAVQSNGTVVDDIVESTFVPGESGRPGFHVTIHDPLPFELSSNTQAAVGGHAKVVSGKWQVASTHSVAQPPRIPRGGASSMVWTAIFVTFGYVCVRILKRREAQRQFIATIAKNYNLPTT